MNQMWIKCKNEHCSNKLKVEANSFKPILFCTEKCLNSYFIHDQKLDINSNYQDPKVRMLVQNLVDQTKQIQNELRSLKKIRKTYFGIFRDLNLKDEVYKRKWSFEDKNEERD